ncbi:hypothetical protein ACVII0_003913 [Sinorhizobium meliloti]
MQSFALNPLWPAGHLPHKGGDDKRLDLHVSQTMPSADRITGGQRGGRNAFPSRIPFGSKTLRIDDPPVRAGKLADCRHLLPRQREVEYREILLEPRLRRRL